MWLRWLTGAIVIVTVLQNSVLAAELPLKGRNVPEWTAKISAYGGSLLLSDSPEVVPGDGIMYRDVIQGDSRLFFHHVNGTAQDKKITVLLENSSDKVAEVTVSRYGLAGPDYDYVAVGKKVQEDYIGGEDAYILMVPPHGSVSLSRQLEEMTVKYNMLVNGMYDLKTDAPVKVTVMMLPLEAEVQPFAAGAKVLAPDIGEYRLRGTFPGKDRLVVPEQPYDPAQHGLRAITLADNVLDPYVRGIDATDGTSTTNYGNYGIVYHIYVPTVHGKRLAYYMNPQGGEYAGWLGVTYRHAEDSQVATPGNKLSYGIKNSIDNSWIGTYEGGHSVWITFSPPGASNLPVRLLMAPVK